MRYTVFLGISLLLGMVSFGEAILVSPTLVSCDSQETSAESGQCTRATDQDTTTFWHTQYTPSVTPLPHQIIMDLRGTTLLAWDYTQGPDPATIFRIYRQTACTGGFTLIRDNLPITQQTYTAQGLTPGTQYCFRVTAVDSVGVESIASNIVSDTPLTTNDRKIQGFTYLPRQDGQLNGTIASYELYLSIDGTTWGSPVATGTWTYNNTLKTVRFAGVTARYAKLIALSEGVGNQFISGAEIQLNIVPANPTSMDVTLAWDYTQGNTPAVNFHMYRQEDCDGNAVSISGPLPLSPMTFTDTGRLSGYTYCWQVTAMDSGGAESGPSTVLQSTISGAPVRAPTNFRFTSQTITSTLSVDLAWDYSQGSTPAVNFKLYRQTNCTGSYTQVNGTLPLTPQTYTDSGLTLVTSYCWYVTAIDGSAGESASSNIIQWTSAADVPLVIGNLTSDPFARLGLVNTMRPVHRSHPLLRGVRAWWRVIPGLDGGSHLWDLVGGAYADSTANTVSQFQPTTRDGGDGEIRFTGPAGTSDYLSAGTRIAISAPFTVMAWAKATNPGTNHDLISHSNAGGVTGFLIFFIGSQLYCSIEDYTLHSAIDPSTFPADTWVHIACTWDQTTIRLYRNGTEVATNAYSGTMTVPTTDWQIGSCQGGGPNWQGPVDDILVYNRVLSANEVQSLMVLTKQGSPGLLNRVGPLPRREESIGMRRRGFYSAVD